MGRRFFTSGDDRIYPKGLAVGEVIRVEEGSEFQQIHVRPFAALDRLDEVLIVTAGIHEELPEVARPQPPEYLMPVAPPAEVEAGPSGPGVSGVDPSREEDAVARGEELRTKPPLPLTDADRLKERYRAIGVAQGHRYGEGEPGSPAPNFNIGFISSAGFRGQGASTRIEGDGLVPPADSAAGSTTATESSAGGTSAAGSSAPAQAVRSPASPSGEDQPAPPAAAPR